MGHTVPIPRSKKKLVVEASLDLQYKFISSSLYYYVVCNYLLSLETLSAAGAGNLGDRPGAVGPKMFDGSSVGC